ncbi:MAG UNVERIFIED_CONTAM: hypothetical protein LVT10_05055 [Anaerolineae bacterium]
MDAGLTLGQSSLATVTPTVMVDESVLPTVKVEAPSAGSQAQQGSPLLVSARGDRCGWHHARTIAC